MQRIHLGEDIRPLSEFRAHAASLIKRLQATRRPMVLTQHGHSTAVILGVDDYERLIEEVETLRDLQVAEHEMDSTGGIPHKEAKKQLLSRLER